MSGIGLDSDFVETSGNNIKFIFFISELSPMINLNKDSKGYIDIKIHQTTKHGTEQIQSCILFYAG